MNTEYSYSHKLMGSDLVFSIITSDEQHALAERDKALALGTAYEQRFSRFLIDSELTRLNTEKSMEVSPEFFEVFLIGLQLYRETKGVFNPLVQIERFGYTKTFENISGTTSLQEETPYNIDMESIQIDETTRRITLNEGQRLDVGGFLKGFVAEKMARGIENVSGAIVNLGGDIFTVGTDTSGIPFEFDILNPISGTNETSVPVQDAGIATSGTYRRAWDTQHGKKHHILSEKGDTNPESDLVSATIVAPEGYRSDAYATVAIILGSTDAQIFLKTRDTRFVLITKSGSIISNIV